MLIQELDAPLLPAFRSTRLRALREHPTSFGASYEEEQARPVEFWARRLRSSETDDFVLCGVDDAAVIATVAFHRERGEKLRHRGMLTAVYVAPEHRGRRRGEQLLTAAIERAFALDGLEVLSLGVGSHNRGARRVYEALGFEVIGEDRYAMRVGGEYVAELLMMLAKP